MKVMVLISAVFLALGLTVSYVLADELRAPTSIAVHHGGASTSTPVGLRQLRHDGGGAAQSWALRVGDKVVVTSSTTTRIGVVGPGLGEPSSSAWGVAGDGGRVAFDATEPGTYLVGDIDSSEPLGTIVVTRAAGAA